MTTVALAMTMTTKMMTTSKQVSRKTLSLAWGFRRYPLYPLSENYGRCGWGGKISGYEISSQGRFYYQKLLLINKIIMIAIKNKFLSFVLAGATIVALALFGFAMSAKNAGAHIDPVGCTDTGGGVSIAAFRTDGTTNIGINPVYDGEMIKYQATLSALGLPNCAFQGGTWTLTTPDGTVHPLGAVPQIGGGGVPSVTSAMIDYQVDHADEAVEIITATTNYSGGISHANSGDTTPGPVLGTSKLLTVIHPSTDLTKEVDQDSVVSGTEVTYTYTETNDGDVDLINVSVDDDTCSPVTYVSGDDGNDGIMSPDETWVFECSMVINEDTINTAVGHGEDPNGNDVTWTAGCQAQDPEENVICDEDETARAIVEVVQALVVEKTVETSYDRDWDWTIEKSADQTNLLLSEDETFTVNYEVEVSATSEDINHEVSGTITITNPEGNADATIESVSDALDVSLAASVNCGVEFPYVLVGGGQLVCSYEQLDASPDDTENEATVTTSGDVPGGSDTEVVSYGDPVNITDECVTVNDDNANGPQGVEICEDDEDKVIEYAVDFGPEGGEGVDVATVCGEVNHPNMADFITNDNQEEGSDTWEVLITVDCFEGCTLTQGYWKTHNESFWGGAPTDLTWDLILPDAEETILWDDTDDAKDLTWFDAFWTAPQGGNVWYQLAHQWMAASLNVLADADPEDVTPELADAEAWLLAHSPYDKLKGKDNADAKAWASLFGSYNEGLIGRGHCDEQNPPL